MDFIIGGIQMEALGNIAQNTSNDILLLFIVIAIVLVSISIPFFKLYTKAEAEKRKQELLREENILQVIRENTTVNASIKTLLENSVRGCAECRSEQMERFRSIEKGVNILIERSGNHGQETDR